MSWIATSVGRKLDYLCPDAQQISLTDIAVGLSNVARFAGQTNRHYSVAAHSVMCSRMCPEAPLHALLHDAPEAYMGDCPRPLKQALGHRWKYIEDMLLECILVKYGLEPKLPNCVKEVDDRMLFTERRELQPHGPDWGWELAPYDIQLPKWSHEQAAREFIEQFTMLAAEASVGHAR